MNAVVGTRQGPLRILFDDRPARVCVTGIGRYAASLAGLLREGVPGADARFASELPQPAGPDEEELELPHVLAREGIEVLHTPLFQLPALLPPHTRAVVTLHDAIPLARPDLTSPGFGALFRTRAAEGCRRAARVVCPSAHARDEVAAGLGVPVDKLRVVPEAPAARFRPCSAEEQARVCAAYGLEPGRYLLAVGSLERRKGPDLLLDALARVAAALPWLSVAFAGPAHGFDLAGQVDARGLQGRAPGLGVVPDDDLPALYAGALALVFPSRHEGFGLPIVEAFATGTPVVATAATAIPEVAGEAALLVPPEDPDALAAAIERVAADPALRRELVEEGTARLEERFSPGQVRAALGALYAELEVAV